MANFNKVILLGNLTRDPEVRQGPSGASVCSFTLAVNRSHTTQGGERRDETCFIPITVWGRQAASSGQYLKKGRSAMVEGRLRTRNWQTPEGQKRSAMEVIAERVQFLGSPNGAREEAPQSASAEPEPAPAPDEPPF